MITEPFSIVRMPYFFENEIVEIDLPGDANHGRRGWIAALGIDSHTVCFNEDRQSQSYPTSALDRTGERRVAVWCIECDNRGLPSGVATIYLEDGTQLCTNTPYLMACEIVYRLMKHDHKCIINDAHTGKTTAPLDRETMRLEYA